MSKGCEDSPEQIAQTFAWEHFELHASQRLQMFRAFVGFIGLTYAGYGTALQAKALIVAGTLSIFSIFAATVFYLFDLRIRQLLKISERYLLDSELKLSLKISNSNIRLFRKSDLITHIDTRYFRLTYSNLFLGIYGVTALVGLISLVVLPIFA